MKIDPDESFEEFSKRMELRAKHYIDQSIREGEDGDIVAQLPTRLIPSTAVEGSVAMCYGLLMASCVGMLPEFMAGVMQANGQPVPERSQMLELQESLAGSEDAVRYILDTIEANLGLLENNVAMLGSMLSVQSGVDVEVFMDRVMHYQKGKFSK